MNRADPNFFAAGNPVISRKPSVISILDLVVGNLRPDLIFHPSGGDEMAEFVAYFPFDEAIEIILPETREEQEETRNCLCCQRLSRQIDDDGAHLR